MEIRNTAYYKAVAGSYTLSPLDLNGNIFPLITIDCDTTAGPITIDLFELNVINGRRNFTLVVVDKADLSATNNITINAGGTDTIDEALNTSVVIDVNGSSLTLNPVSPVSWSAFESRVPPASIPAVIIAGAPVGSSIRCGNTNTVTGDYATVSGGVSNTSSGTISTISGGYGNTASGNSSNVSGGSLNSSSGNGSTIGGGQQNTASGNYSTISGGLTNQAVGGTSSAYTPSPNTISGGSFNIIQGNTLGTWRAGGNTISGGISNIVTSSLYNHGNTIGGGCSNTVLTSSFSTISGGLQNTASHNYTFVGGGRCHTASGCFSTVSGGYFNTASGNYSTISGGYKNIASFNSASIAGGYENTASAYYSVVSGGYQNTASGAYSVISGGRGNTASSSYSTVSGGYLNSASGPRSTVTGGEAGIASRYAQRTFSAGKFAVNGDAQSTELIARNTTINNTPTNLFLDGVSTTITIASGFSMYATISVAGIKTDGTTAAHYCRKVAIKNIAGTTSLIGAVSTIGTDVEDNPNYDVTITADNTNDALDIKVTGDTGQTLRWVAYINAIEIKMI